MHWLNKDSDSYIVDLYSTTGRLLKYFYHFIKININKVS